MNQLVDDAPNPALDRNEDWFYGHEDAIARAKRSEVNYRLSFDGAKRGNGESAAGVVLLAYYHNGERDLLMRAEALALEWSLEVLFPFLVKS